MPVFLKHFAFMFSVELFIGTTLNVDSCFSAFPYFWEKGFKCFFVPLPTDLLQEKNGCVMPSGIAA